MKQKSYIQPKVSLHSVNNEAVVLKASEPMALPKTGYPGQDGLPGQNRYQY